MSLFTEVFKKEDGYIGIDITKTQVNLVELLFDTNTEKPKLITYGAAPITSQAPQEISQAIIMLKEQARVTATRAVFGVNNKDSRILRMILPYETKQEQIPSIIKKKAKEHIGEDVRQMAIGHSIISHTIARNPDGTANEEGSGWHVLFVATPQKEITALQEIAKRSGLEFIAPEVKAQAASRALAMSEPLDTILLASDETELISLESGAVEKVSLVTEETKIPEHGYLAGKNAEQQRQHLQLSEANWPIANPWKGMMVPRGLEEILQHIGPTMTVACGLALREIVKKNTKL